MSTTSGIGEITGISIGFDASTPDGERRGSSRTTAIPGRNPREKDNTDATGLKLSEEEKQTVRKLQQRDREVRTHEQAHIAASGGHAIGGASYTRQRGPDGQMYAIGGNVSIDTSSEDNPDATIAKAQRVRAAANAPAEPSGQDRAVAARAAQMEAQARQEKAAEKQESKESRSSIDGPVALSGSSLEGPASSVSGPPQALNRRVDAFGNTDSFDAGNAQARRQENAQATAQSHAAQRMYAETDAAAAYQQQAIAAADATAAYQAAQSMLQASQNADAANAADLQALQAGDLNAAYARTLDVYALGSADSTQFSNQFSAPQQNIPDRDAIRLGIPTARTEAASATPQISPSFAMAAAPAASAVATSSTTSTAAAPSNTAMERATRVYQRMGYTPTALAPYGTGISRTV